MTSAETSAPSLDPTFAESKGGPLRRFLAPFAVGLALLSTFLTFVVLTGLTRIRPTPEVVISFLLINTATILLLVGIIIREVWQVVAAGRRRDYTFRL
jgi:two-component system nitrogen regulation sensor histidine kinase NtrY